MNRLLHWLVIGMFILPMFACGGGGGGGGGTAPAPAPIPATVLSGTVTDLTQDHVGGATVTVTDYMTGAAVFGTTADAAGRYSFDETQLPVGTILTVTADGPAGYFPASAQAFLSTGSISVLDLVLPSTRYRGTNDMASATIDNSVGTILPIQSETFIDAVEFASLNVPADSLLDATATPYVGTATAYLTPVDIAEMGNGFGYYQTTILPLAVGDIYPDDFLTPPQVLELYAAGAFEIFDASGNLLAIDNTDDLTRADLTLPIPVEARANAALLLGPATLWHFDETINKWMEIGIATPDDPNTPTTYTAKVSLPGLYRVGEAVPATIIQGRLLYSNLTPAAGATVYVNGSGGDVYQQVLSTDAAGNFFGLVKDSSMADLEFVVRGPGVQLTHDMAVDLTLVAPGSTHDLGDITLNFSGPTSPATITLDGDDLSAPNTIGFLPASGRFYVETDDLGNTDAVVISNVADANFVADVFAGDSLSIESTATGSEIKLASSTVWGTTPIDVGSAVLPLVVDVKTGDPSPFYARITIEGVTQSPGGNIWTATFSSQFSLTAF